MTVDVRARVLPFEGEEDTGMILDERVDALEARAQIFEGDRFPESEIKIFGEPVIGKVAALQGSTAFEGENGLQIGLGERNQEPSQAIVAFENVFSNPHGPAGREAIGKHRDVSLGNQSGAPNGLQFFGWKIYLQAPFSKVAALPVKNWIERDVGGGQRLSQRLQLRLSRNAEQFEQIAQAPVDGAHLEAAGIGEEFVDARIGVTHPEALGDFSDPAAILGVQQSVEDGPFEVADLYGLLFGDPMLSGAKKVLRFEEDEAELRAMNGLPGYALGAGNEHDELRLGHHAVEFHGRSMREEVRGSAGQIARDQIGVPRILDRRSEFGRNDDKEAALQLGHETALFGFVEEAAGQGRFQSGDAHRIGGSESGLPGIVERRQKLGHLAAGCPQVPVIDCAQ